MFHFFTLVREFHFLRLTPVYQIFVFISPAFPDQPNSQTLPVFSRPIETVASEQELSEVVASQPAGDTGHTPSSRLSLLFCHTSGYLPSQTGSPAFSHYQIILLGDRVMSNLLSVIT